MKISEEKLIKAYNKCNGKNIKIKRYLAKEYNVEMSYQAVHKRIKRLRLTGAIALESGHRVSDGEILTGTSTYHKATEDKPAQWIKTTVDKQKYHDSVKEYADNLFEGLQEKYKVVMPPQMLDDKMTTFYPMPDLHFGLLTHGDELNHTMNFDMKIQTGWVLGSMQQQVDISPKSKYAVITDLGDFLHSMDDSNRTKSGHVLDVDGRHGKIVDAAFEIMRQVIQMALAKHELVYFYSVAGNHSDDASIYLRSFLSAYFRNEPRVIVHKTNKAQQYHIFGKNILGFSHGHELKPEKAGQCLVYDNQKIFSDSLHRVFHFGHLHTDKSFEDSLCRVEVHKNIIPADKWADSMGYRGIIGDTKAIYYHEAYGEIGRSRFNISMMETKED